MLESSRVVEVSSTKIGGSSLPSREVNFPWQFGAVARTLWPRKTAFVIAKIGCTTDRAAKEWLSGKVPPPATVIAAIVNEITKRD